MNSSIKTGGDPLEETTEDVHAQIVFEAEQVRNSASTGYRNVESSALAGLLEGAREALEQAMPMQFVHAGRVYWLQVVLPMASLNVFALPTASTPLVSAMCGSNRVLGHHPHVKH